MNITPSPRFHCSMQAVNEWVRARDAWQEIVADLGSLRAELGYRQANEEEEDARIRLQLQTNEVVGLLLSQLPADRLPPPPPLPGQVTGSPFWGVVLNEDTEREQFVRVQYDTREEAEAEANRQAERFGGTAFVHRLGTDFRGEWVSLYRVGG